MPLPKTETIVARATEVYCEVWSVILQKYGNMPPARAGDLDELSQLLPYLRQLLTCCACAGILNQAMISITCGHCYCYECQFREPLLKIHCRQCRGRTGLVNEKQLQLLVDCYKHMCHILGEKLRKEGKENQNRERLSEKDPESMLHLSVFEDEPAVCPIAEIIREVEKGTKVSRAVFIIKPPLKYINAKDSLPPKREPVTNTSGTSVQPMSISTTSANGGEEVGDSVSVNCYGSVSTNDGKMDVDLPDSGSVETSGTASVGTHALVKNPDMASEETPASVRIPDTALVETLASVRNPCSINTSCSVSVEAAVPVKKTVKKLEVSKKKCRCMHKPLVVSATSKATPSSNTPAQKPSSSQLPYKRKRKRKTLTLSEPLPPVGSELGNTDVRANASVSSHDSSSIPLKIMTVTCVYPPEPHSLFAHGRVPINDLGVCVSCLDQRYFNIAPDTVSLLHGEQLPYKIEETLDMTSSARDMRSNFTPGQWKKNTRKRVWGPLCRSVMVKRQGEDIAQMLILQIKSAEVKRKERQNVRPAISQGRMRRSRAIATSSLLPSQPPPPVPPPPPPHFPPLPPSPLVPSSLPPVTPNDIPIPENLSLLSRDGRDNDMDEDINWLEVSNFYESPEDSLPALPTLPCYPSQHHYQTPPLPPSELGSIHFEDFDVLHQQQQQQRQQKLQQQRQLQQQQQQQQHHRQRGLNLLPLLSRPTNCVPVRHHPSSLPHTCPPTPYSPLMGHISPQDSFFAPVTSGGIRPNLGGYSNPVTPMGSFPGPCPEELLPHQNPGPPSNALPHTAGGMFPFSSGSGFPPVGMVGFPRPASLTSAISPKKKSNAMSDLVGKMKIKSPLTPKDLLATPSPTKKQRRSPGESEAGWRCRCGTNNVMFPEKVCAKGKCPCYSKGNACKNCLCRFCHNPFGSREHREQTGTTPPFMEDPGDQ